MSENNDLRVAFELLQKELSGIMEQRKEIFLKRYAAEHGIDGPDFEEFEISEIKSEVLKMPFD
eukprot:CAMPEP_0168313524 /NCGR_PEP_ID=MMETSP0210-20121227/2501_1 /TAXON_ID=40633 /ORGANISM="Condylostoma magnum, Strain COL2" /LENGTH=62 /DNA_ID=CAMNT_0008271115 /DNA_START=556 /DNA_END=744 /DNA_ORIENTATION=+